MSAVRFLLYRCSRSRHPQRRATAPSYIRAAGHDLAVSLYEKYCEQVSAAIGKPVGRGVFGADMQVSLVNDGPVTIIIDLRVPTIRFVVKEVRRDISFFRDGRMLKIAFY